MANIDEILKKSNIAKSIFKNLSKEEVRRVKGVSTTFYHQATEYLTGNLESSNRHLERVIPPSNTIKRHQQVGLNAKLLQSLIARLIHQRGEMNEEFDKFNSMMEKIRLAVQSNLGLSRVEREQHETFHPIYVKLGAPVFPVDGHTAVDDAVNHIIYQSDGVMNAKDKKSPKVILFKDNSDEDGLAICFDTKFRKFVLHIDAKGHVASELSLKWEAIYEDLLPDTGAQQPLRSFTPWQRHSEANFFNGRSTNKVLRLLTNNFPDVFEYDPTAYFKESPASKMELTVDNPLPLFTDNENVYVTLENAYFTVPEEFIVNSKNHPILAVIKSSSPLRGDCFSVVPAIYENNELHILIKGHQQQTEVVDIFHADFKTAELSSWALSKPVVIYANSFHERKPDLVELNLLSSSNVAHMAHVSTAPMVRGSGPGARQYWLSEFLDSTVYSEMIVIAQIFNREFLDTPLATLEQTLNHADATKGFYRLQFSKHELEKAKAIVFQLTIPNTFSKQEDFEFFYGKDGTRLEETTKLAIQLLKKMVPEQYHEKIRIGINMCCPAASVENIGAGFGLRHKHDFIERIVRAVNDVDARLEVEFKTLMLSHQDNHGKPTDDVPSNPETISEKQNKRFTRVVAEANSDRLVYQAKPRNIEAYDSGAIAQIIKKSKTHHMFRFGFSGMVSAITNHGVLSQGYEGVGEPHYSVESILNQVSQQLGNVPPQFEVMLGRVLLGSAWVLQGKYASDAEILLHTLIQAAIEREWAKGMGRYGVDIFQIQVLYNVRHLTNDEYRNTLIEKIHNGQSMDAMIDDIFDQYLTVKKKGECNVLGLHELERAVFAALPNNKLLHRYELAVAGDDELMETNDRNQFSTTSL